ncbi:hypothetical protein MKW98_001183 [Papaver atlanticum]|uniref:Fe2OG dioxygenase domain-containing protein n=1 Tax=Papaver atlanticum TaxID=357466 RepID=A0AAD4SUL6_9MAGN|nr:hypothetical protein MKW98_001183 [Papaver atlanticum]
MSFGISSLIVPSVHEMVKEKITTLPDRYIRTSSTCNLNHEDHDSHSSAKYTMPIINIECLLSGDPTLADSELQKLDSACKDWGFFQVVNHGISSSLIEKLKSEVHNLFELQLEEKKKLWQKPGDQEGYGHQFVVSDDQKLDWYDMFLIATLPTRIRKAHLFAAISLPLREALEAYSLGLKKLTMILLGQMCKALKMDSNEMIDLFNDCSQRMRLSYYPPCPKPEQVLGASPHSDACALTILLQINGTDGLQIRKDGKWLLVKPLLDAFIVNVGDMIEILSNGVYCSIEHRVVIHPTKERISIATFHSTNLDAEIGPALSLIDPYHRPALFRRETSQKYFQNYFSHKEDGKSNLDYMRI